MGFNFQLIYFIQTVPLLLQLFVWVLALVIYRRICTAIL